MDNRYSVRVRNWGLDLENINHVYQCQKLRFPNNSGFKYHFTIDRETNLVYVSEVHENDIFIGEFDTLFFDQGGMRKIDLIDTIHGYMQERGIK